MRKVIEEQAKLGSLDISQIKFDDRSRDEIPELLRGLQYIYTAVELRSQVFNILEEVVPSGISSNNGRPGMGLWKILVLGTLRLNCNWDYDKLHDISNNHKKVREMLGHGGLDWDYYYPLQTLKDNISLFTPEVLDKINKIVVEAGHKELKKKEGEDLKGRCDSFVVETDVHYPTDINLLFDAVRKVIMLMFRLSIQLNIKGWRESGRNIKKIKQLYRRIQKAKRSTSKDETKQASRERLILLYHKSYIELVEIFIDKAKETIELIRSQPAAIKIMSKLLEIELYIKHAERQIDQIRRRALNGEVIEHKEKKFSIFEEHTEWISKGKAGVPQELGLRVCILEDKYGFILHHKVMEKETDDAVTLEMVESAQVKFSDLKSCSFDKGFYSPSNRERLIELLDIVILPKKGRLSCKDKALQEEDAFIKGRLQHSAVESAINALENHSLDRCPDHGLVGFKRYVALAVLSRNIQLLGKLLRQKELKNKKRLENKYNSSKESYRLAA